MHLHNFIKYVINSKSIFGAFNLTAISNQMHGINPTYANQFPMNTIIYDASYSTTKPKVHKHNSEVEVDSKPLNIKRKMLLNPKWFLRRMNPRLLGYQNQIKLVLMCVGKKKEFIRNMSSLMINQNA